MLPSDSTLSLQPAGCAQCKNKSALPFDFTYAYQPIADIGTRSIFAHEALVRGPDGEPAYSVLSQVNDDNRYCFDQACRMEAIRGAAELGMKELLSINFLPNAVYRRESKRRPNATFCAMREST